MQVARWMLVSLWLGIVGVTSTVAVDCSTVVIQQKDRSCEVGFVLVTEETIFACQAQLCAAVGEWALVGFANPDRVFAGTGYRGPGCGTQGGVNVPHTASSICQPAPPTPAPPTPSPPTPAPTVDCSTVVIQQKDRSCEVGFVLVTEETIFACQAQLCAAVGEWALVGFANPDRVFAGTGYRGPGCGTQGGVNVPHTASSICQPAA